MANQYRDLRKVISEDLIEAYSGVYEDEMASDLTVLMEEPEHETEWVVSKILSDTPQRRLEVYMEWNGIIGYSDRAYELATGQL